MSILNVYTLMGLFGFALDIGSYAALQLGFLRGQGYAYASLNAIGAGAVLLSLRQSFNLSAALIEISWIAISVVGIARYYTLTHRVRFTVEEREFLEATMPDLQSIQARQLLNLISWHSGDPGTRLTKAGEHSANLYYLVTGSADVFIEGKVIARLGINVFIGEMGLIRGTPASATVALAETSRYLALPVSALQQLMKRDVDIRTHLNASLYNHVVAKLVRTNEDVVYLMAKSAGQR